MSAIISVKDSGPAVRRARRRQRRRAGDVVANRHVGVTLESNSEEEAGGTDTIDESDTLNGSRQMDLSSRSWHFASWRRVADMES